MIINQVSGGSGPDVLDNDVIPLDNALTVLFKNYSNRGMEYNENFSGPVLKNVGTALMDDKHIYQSYLKTDGDVSRAYGPSETVSLSTHIDSSFNKTSVGEKKGSGLMFVYFGLNSSSNVGIGYLPCSDSSVTTYGIFTKFTFDFTDGKDVITPERTSVGGEDIRTTYPTYPEAKLSGVLGYIMRATFE